MKQFLLNIKAFDLFGSEIGLHMNQSFKYTTSLGGYASILAIGFILSFFWSRIISFIKQEDVFVSTNRYYDANPPESSLNTDTFMFALRIYQPNRDFVTNPYFNITINQWVISIEENEQKIKSSPIDLEPCTLDHWKQMKTQDNFADLFSSFGSDYLCPVLGQQLQIQGMFQSDIFKYIDIEVKPCISPKNPSLKWNPTCASESEVMDATQKFGQHGMNIYHSNYVINPDQPKKYFTPYINDKLYFTFVPDKMTTLSDIYFQNITVKTDTSLLPFNKYEQINFLTQENNDIRQTVQLSRTDEIYVILTLRLSPYVSIINRSFKKVQDLMSQLGGFIQLVIACLSILLTRYNQFQFIIELASNLYSFDQKNDKKRTEKAVTLEKNIQKKELKLHSHKQQKQTIKDKEIEIQLDSQMYSNSKRNQLVFSSSPNNHNFNNNSEQLKHLNFSNEQIEVRNAVSCHEKSLEQTSFQDKVLQQNVKEKHNNQNTQQIISLKTDRKTKTQSEFVELDCLSSLSNQSDKPIFKVKNVVRSIIQKNTKFLSFLNIENERKEQLEQFQQVENGKKRSYLIQQFNKIILKNKKLVIGFQYFASQLTFQKLFNSETNQYIQKATDLIHTDLDICNILDKIQQIDKLKTTIFNSEQLLLFNFLQKPKIENNDRKNISSRKIELQSVLKHLKEINAQKNEQKQQKNGVISQKIAWDSVESYKKLYNSYSLIQTNLEKDKLQKNLNQKLIQGLGPDILRIFEMSKKFEEDNKQNNHLKEIEENDQKKNDLSHLMLECQTHKSKHNSSQKQIQIDFREQIDSKNDFHQFSFEELGSINSEDKRDQFNLNEYQQSHFLTMFQTVHTQNKNQAFS